VDSQPQLYIGCVYIYIYHCKNKLVVLTTQWLPWLQTN